MALTVNTNLASISALNNLNRTNRSLSATFGRISSGMRINQAGDDAAGLAVAENLDSAARSLEVAKRNTNDGMSVLSIAEGASSEVGNIIKRMRELAVQSSSETLDDDERAYLQDEFTQLAGEVDRIASTTEFNGVQLADGSATSIDVQVGIQDSINDRLSISLGDLRGTVLGVDTGSLDLSAATKAQAALTAIDAAQDTVNSYRAGFGATQNRMEITLSNLETYTENISAAKSQILDADFAKEAADMSKFQIMQQAGTAILAQANTINQGALRLLG